MAKVWDLDAQMRETATITHKRLLIIEGIVAFAFGAEHPEYDGIVEHGLAELFGHMNWMIFHPENADAWIVEHGLEEQLQSVIADMMNEMEDE